MDGESAVARYAVYGVVAGLLLVPLAYVGLAVGMASAEDPTAHRPTEPALDGAQSGDGTNGSGGPLETAGLALMTLGLLHVVVIPASVYADLKHVRRATDWRPIRPVWLLPSLVPVVQVFAVPVYLARRAWVLSVAPRVGRGARTRGGSGHVVERSHENASPTDDADGWLGSARRSLVLGVDLVGSLVVAYVALVLAGLVLDLAAYWVDLVAVAERSAAAVSLLVLLGWAASFRLARRRRRDA